MKTPFIDTLGDLEIRVDLRPLRESWFVSKKVGTLKQILRRWRRLLGGSGSGSGSARIEPFHGYVVPPGEVVVVMFGFEHEERGGLPQVYLQGERIEPRTFTEDATYEVLVLSQNVGEIQIRGRHLLAGVDKGEGEASIDISMGVRLHDPSLLMKEVGLKEAGDPEQFNANVSDRVGKQLRDFLVGRSDGEVEGVRLWSEGVHLWSEDQGHLISQIIHYLRLENIGLLANMNYIFFERRFPRSLYEIALQFINAEQSVSDYLAAGRGIDDEHLRAFLQKLSAALTRSTDRDGVTLLKILYQLNLPEKKAVVDWLDDLGLVMAAKFVSDLYQGDYPDTEVYLTQQVLLQVVRNPWLTWGEWLRDFREDPITRLRLIERRLEQVR